MLKFLRASALSNPVLSTRFSVLGTDYSRPATRDPRLTSLLLLFACTLGNSLPVAAQLALQEQEQEQEQAPQVSSAVSPREVTVGTRFSAVIRVAPVAGGTVALLRRVSAAPGLQQTGDARIDTAADGAITAVYPLVAWQPGELPEVRVPLRITRGESALVVRVRLPLPAVRAVLPPPGTDGVEPRPAAPVLRPPLWPAVLIALLGLLALAALVTLWVRRRGPAVPGAAPLPPFEIAMARLDALAPLPDSDAVALQIGVAAIVREYLDAVSPGCGADLTSAEAIACVASQDRTAARPLREMLEPADLLKFSGGVPASGGAEVVAYVGHARRWLRDFDAARLAAGVPSGAGSAPAVRVA